MGEIIKHEAALANYDNKQTVNKTLATMNPEARIAYIEVVREAIAEKHPTMANRELYYAKRTEAEIAEDFSILNRGEIISGDIVKAGGFSDRYKRDVAINAEANHWKKFWITVNEAEEVGMRYPNFIWNLEHIHWYAFHYLPVGECVDYLKKLRLELLINQQEYRPEMIEHVDKELKSMLDKIKDILQ